MSVIGLHGVPGSGKTLSSVVIARKYYKKENGLIRRFIRKKKGKEEYLNNIYSNFPILLDKKKKIYSRIISIDDCNNDYSFLEHSILILDEVQAFYDSYRDFKSFPKEIATFFQFHRHFGIQDIYLISQHPRRLVTYLKDVITQFNRMRNFIKIPFIHLGIITYRTVFEFDDYKFAFSNSDEIKQMYDIRRGIYFFNYKKVFNSFLSIYLFQLNEDKPLLDKGCYDNVFMREEVLNYLNDRLFGKKTERRKSLSSAETSESEDHELLQDVNFVI